MCGLPLIVGQPRPPRPTQDKLTSTVNLASRLNYSGVPINFNFYFILQAWSLLQPIWATKQSSQQPQFAGAQHLKSIFLDVFPTLNCTSVRKNIWLSPSAMRDDYPWEHMWYIKSFWFLSTNQKLLRHLVVIRWRHVAKQQPRWKPQILEDSVRIEQGTCTRFQMVCGSWVGSVELILSVVDKSSSISSPSTLGVNNSTSMGLRRPKRRKHTQLSVELGRVVRKSC